MKNKEFNKGIVLTALGSFWWGVFGVIYFKYISFAGHIEVVIHRTVWTSLTLILSTIYFSKWNIFFDILKNLNILLTLFFLYRNKTDYMILCSIIKVTFNISIICSYISTTLISIGIFRILDIILLKTSYNPFYQYSHTCQ